MPLSLLVYIVGIIDILRFFIFERIYTVKKRSTLTKQIYVEISKHILI